MTQDELRAALLLMGFARSHINNNAYLHSIGDNYIHIDVLTNDAIVSYIGSNTNNTFRASFETAYTFIKEKLT